MTAFLGKPPYSLLLLISGYEYCTAAVLIVQLPINSRVMRLDRLIERLLPCVRDFLFLLRRVFWGPMSMNDQL